MNINELFNEAQTAEDVDFPEDLTEVQVPAGTKLPVQVVYSGVNKKGTGINMSLKVLQGEHKDGRVFTGLTISTKESNGAKRYNKAMFAKLEALGITSAFFSSNPSWEAVASAVKDVKAELTFEWNDLDSEFFPGGLSNDSVLTPLDGGGGGGYVPKKTVNPKGF